MNERTNQKLRICILSPTTLFPVRGTSVRVLNFGRALAHKPGNRVSIVEFTLGAKTSRCTRVHNGLDISTMVYGHSNLKKHAYPIYAVLLVMHILGEIRWLLREKEFDLFQCTGPQMAFVGILVRQLFARPVVADLHSSSSIEAKGAFKKRLLRVVEKSIIRNVDFLVVPTQELKDFYCSWGFSSAKIHVVANVLDTSRFVPKKDREEIRSKLRITATEKVIVFHGMLNNDYNVQSLQNLYRISKIVRAKIDAVKFLIIGPYKEKPVESDIFVYTGYVDDLPDYLNIADFAIVPIFLGSLGIRSRLIEYFACGVPVITTPDGVTGMHFVEEQGAVIVKENVEDIAGAAVELATDQMKLSRMKENCSKVISMFALDVGAQKLEALYTSMFMAHS